MFEEQFELLDCAVVKDTIQAVLISSPEFEEPIWVPKSVITDDSEVWEDSTDGAGPGTLMVDREWAEDQEWF